MNPTRSPLLIVGAVLVLILIGLAVAYLPVASGIRSWFSSMTMSSTVGQLEYLGVENNTGIIYSIRAGKVEKRSFDGFSVVDYIRQGDSKVAILRSDNDQYDIYDVSGDTPEQLTSDGKEKQSLDLSPDGTHIVYGVKVRSLPLPKGATEDDVVYHLPEWDVEYLDTTTKEVSLVGPGNNPRFFKEGLFYPAPSGFVYRVIDGDGFSDSDTWSIFPDVMAYRVLSITMLTPDGVLVVPSVTLPVYEKLHIDSVSPLKLSAHTDNPVAVPAGTRDLYISPEGKTYLITPTTDGAVTISELHKDSLTTVYTFPRGYYPERFIPTN